MQKLFLISLTSFLLFACGSNSGEAEDTSVTETPAPMEVPAETPVALPTESQPALFGLYTNGSHDQSWAVYLEEKDGKWIAKAVESDAMLPPVEEIFNHPEEFKFVPFQTFELNEDQKTFSSDWGKGRFESKQEGMCMIFEQKKGLYHPETAQTDPELLLYKRDS